MAYEPTNWKTGDVVTSEKLNKLENGVANGGGFLKVASSLDDQERVETMDKTWQEIHDALVNGEYVVLVDAYDEYTKEYSATQSRIVEARYVKAFLNAESFYQVTVKQISDDGVTEEGMRYTCPTANDYPQYNYPEDAE